MLTAIKKRFMKNKPVPASEVTDEEASAALSNAAFRGILSFAPMFEDIKNDLGIDLLDYSSLDDYMAAVKAELVSREDGVAMSVDAHSAGPVQLFASSI